MGIIWYINVIGLNSMKKENVSILLCTVRKSVSCDFILFPFQVKFTNKAGFDPGVAQLKSIYLNEL